MRAFYLLFGIFFLVFSSLAIKPKLLAYEVQTKGQLVNVMLWKVPDSKGFIDFDYKGKQYDKQVPAKFHHYYRAGDMLVLRHLEGTDIFLFPDETMTTQFLGIGFMILFSAALIFAGIRKKPS